MATVAAVLVRIATGWDGGDVPVDPDGFVHLSTPAQVPGTVERHHPGAVHLVLLVVDPARLPAGALRLEETGHGTFPHLYAPLPANAVVRTAPWRPGQPIELG